MTAFNAHSTTDEVVAGVSMAGSTVLVTGASAGLGAETCRVLAGVGAEVIMVARDMEKLQSVQQAIQAGQPDARLDTATLDLADLDSVREGAAGILARHPRIDRLINNAGLMACPLARTKQGHELQFGTNHLGHFLLTGLLAPALLAAAEAGSRVRGISLSSTGHKLADIDFDDPDYLRREYHKGPAYGQSKTANVLFAVGLDQRLAERGVRAFAVHPGMIMTDLGRHLLPEDVAMLQERAASSGDGGMAFKSVEQGAATTVWAATSPELEGRGALYLEDCQIAEPAAPGEDGGVESYAIDPVAADRLWALSEELVGEAFAF